MLNFVVKGLCWWCGSEAEREENAMRSNGELMFGNCQPHSSSKDKYFSKALRQTSNNKYTYDETWLFFLNGWSQYIGNIRLW